MGLPAAGLLPPARSLSPSPSLPPYLRNPAQQDSSCWGLWTEWGLFLPSWDPDMQPPVVSLPCTLCTSGVSVLPLWGKSLCLSSLILQNRCHSQSPLRARAAFIPVLSCVFACLLGLGYMGLFNGIALPAICVSNINMWWFSQLKMKRRWRVGVMTQWTRAVALPKIGAQFQQPQWVAHSHLQVLKIQCLLTSEVTHTQADTQTDTCTSIFFY